MLTKILTKILTNKRVYKGYIKSGYIARKEMKNPHKTYDFPRFYAGLLGGDGEI